VHDPRLTWNTVDIVKQLGGEPVQTKCGHAFIKERMRNENAAYGGEMSAHHYFRDFAFCDSGMIPWLLVTGLISESGQSLSSMVAERVAAYPCSGEINRSVEDAGEVLSRVGYRYRADAVLEEDVDGLSMDMGQWRFNLRMSNTEPVVRLNVESRGDRALMEEKTRDLLALIEG
jgi:phosphomannomutase